MQQEIIFDLDLIRRYDKAGPRYTSYPTAVQFHNDFKATDYQQYALNSNQSIPLKPLSLYIHIPFCDTVCFYCACNKMATKDHNLAKPYLQRLHQENCYARRAFFIKNVWLRNYIGEEVRQPLLVIKKCVN
jgi:oxygen-independent coproporphyrinogen-3 oxidase